MEKDGESADRGGCLWEHDPPPGWRDAFETACAAGHLVSLRGALHHRIVDDWPGFGHLWQPEALWDFLSRRSSPVAPIFAFEKLLTTPDELFRRCSDSDRPILEWVLGLYRQIDPCPGAAFRKLLDRYQLRMPEPDGEPVLIHSSDWSRFARAGYLGYISLPRPIRSIAVVFRGWVFSWRVGDALAGEFLVHATPFEGPGGRVLVVHCNSPLSTKMLVAAQSAVQKQPSHPLTQHEQYDHLIQAELDAVASHRDQRKNYRQSLLIDGDALGLTNTEIADLYLGADVFGEPVIDPDTHDRNTIMAHTSVVREVKRDRSKIRKVQGEPAEMKEEEAPPAARHEEQNTG